MKIPALLLCKGKKFQSQGLGKFAKDILIQGRYTHPSTGQIVDLSDPERLQRLARNTTLYRRNGNKVPFPDGHTTENMKNLGDWDESFIVQDGRLWGVVNPKAKGVEERLASGAIDGVSAMIEFDVKDSKGNVYPEVMTHICATDYPVIPGQKQFIQLSRMGNHEVPLYLSKELTGMSPEGHTHSQEGHMDPKKMALALGLPETATAEQILEAAAKATDAQKQALAKAQADQAQATALSAALKTNGLEFKDGKLVKLSSDDTETPREREMREELSKLKLDSAKDKLSAAKARAQEFVKSGKIAPALAEKLAKLFAIKDRVESLALSADGQSVTGVPVDLQGTLSEVLSAIHGITGTKLSQLKAAEGDPKEKSADDLAKAGAALAREVQGGKKETT